MDATQKNRTGLWALVTVLAAYCIAFSGWGSQPEVVHSLMSGLQMTPTTAGMLASVELIAVALTTFALAPRIRRFPMRQLCLFGAVLAVIGHGATAGLTAVLPLAVARIVAGVGEGCALAVANAVIASFKDPDRGYAQVNTITLVFSMSFLALLQHLGQSYGYQGVFAALALVCLLFTPFVLGLPRSISSPTEHTSEGGVLSSKRGSALLVALLLFGTGFGASFAFLIQIAEWIEVDSDLLTLSISSWAVGGIVGGTLAAWLSAKAGRFVPIAVTLVVEVVAIMLLVYWPSVTAYLVVGPIQAGCIYFIMPYLLGTAAMIDKTGGCAAAVGGMWMVTGATGPLLGGLLVRWGGFEMLGWTLLVGGVLSLPLLHMATRQDRPATG
jgi:predicted MFS family arabinose efflux permease